MPLHAKVAGKVYTVYGYTRSILAGPSSASQQTEIENHFALLQPDGFAYGGCFSDPFSSGRVPLDKRKAGAELDRHLEPGAQVVIAKTSAILSHPKDFCRIVEAWIKRGVGVHLLDAGIDTRTELGRIKIGWLRNITEAFYVILPREQACASVAKKRSLRKALNGNPSLGFKLVGPRGQRHCVPDPEEREVIGEILEWYKEGHSITRIYFALIENRVRTRAGREWGRTRIWNAIRAALRLQLGPQRTAARVSPLGLPVELGRGLSQKI